ncbi:hypothetical protein Poly51_49170 [Rubripirellula tenax]|uniref:Uncharacterized protein n=1 Tax=Rubripirellula tenax TaxID=2528015 RepID=A0A5C6EGQ6_9BACT|nr:hypothetical protein Poly51_49170 [Rubripirellula tenax]
MTCTGGRLAAFLAMDDSLSVPRDVRRYPDESAECRPDACDWALHRPNAGCADWL